MTWSSQIPGKGGFVCCDTRLTPSLGDLGCKLQPTSTGWTTGAGKLDIFEAGVRALMAGGKNMGTGAKEIVDTALAPFRLSDYKNHFLLLEPDARGIVVLSKGEVHEMGCAGDGPNDLAAEWPAIGTALVESFRVIGSDLGTRIRWAAACFWRMAQKSKDMSDVLEVGYILPTPDGPVRGFLRGEAREIAEYPLGLDIFERFQAEHSGMLPTEALQRTDLAEVDANSLGFIVAAHSNMIGMGGTTSYQAGGTNVTSNVNLISIAAHTLHVGNSTVTYNSGSVTVGGVATYYVYADDPTFAGGAVTYFATTTLLTLADADGRYFVGQITTTAGAGTSPLPGGGGHRPV